MGYASVLRVWTGEVAFAVLCARWTCLTLQRAKVPPYTALLHTMWSPELHKASKVAEMAAIPLAQQ